MVAETFIVLNYYKLYTHSCQNKPLKINRNVSKLILDVCDKDEELGEKKNEDSVREIRIIICTRVSDCRINYEIFISLDGI